MTSDAIKQVKASYAAITATPRQLAARFYQELFSAAPSLRPLFPGDLTGLQGHWGAPPGDYVTARNSLVAAVGALSPSWTPALEEHWRTAVTAIIVPMLEGAAVHTALAAERLAGEHET